MMAVQTGLRLSEITGVKRDDLMLRNGRACSGDRQRPQGALHAVGEADGRRTQGWLREPSKGQARLLFPNVKGEAFECSRGEIHV